MTHIAILGAGIAGLSSGWLLQQKGIDFTVIEKQSYIGGLARSFDWHGFSCDFAAHRLFTRNEDVLQQMLSLVPMGRHIRRSKLFLKGSLMNDPLDVMELMRRCSPSESAGILWTFFTRNKGLEETNFENFVIKRYGRSLYRYFFQPYTEKLFGISGDQISVLWAREKVRLKSPLDNLRENSKTKFQYFYYPVRGGYGAIVNSLYKTIQDRVVLNAQVTGIHSEGSRIHGVRYRHDGVEHDLHADAVISTLPMSITGHLLNYPLRLDFQKVDAVYLWINKPTLSDYHWIYFMDPDTTINRMVEFKNMSPVDTDADTTVVCAEVTMDVDDPVQKVVEDLLKAGLLQPSDILDTKVIREKFAYPVYNQDYEKILAKAETYFNQYENLYLVGRAAEFRHREADDNFESAVNSVEKIAQITAGARKPAEEVIPMPLEKTAPSVFAVILTYNHYQDTQECLDSLQKTEYPDLRIVVVDNGSSDGTPEQLRKDYPNIHVIENEQNLGVPAGYNVGFRYALKNGADYILLLNNDTVVDPGMTAKLVECAEGDTRTGMVMPKVLFYGTKDEVWSAGGRYRAFPPAILMLDKANLYNQQIRTIEYAPTCGLLIHRRAFEKAGLFDPGYFFLFDDWDFSERVRAYGLNIYLVPDAQMWHKVSKTTKDSRMSFYWQTFGSSLTRFYRRHGKPVWFSLPTHVGYIILRDMVWKRNLMYLPDLWHGIKDGLRKPLGSYPSYNQ